MGIDTNMSNKLLFKANFSQDFVYVLRVISLILILLLSYKLRGNIIGVIIILTPLLAILFFSSYTSISVYDDSIKFRLVRLISFFSKEYSYEYIKLKRVELIKPKNNYLIMLLPGGVIRAPQLIFYYLDGKRKVEVIGVSFEDVKKIYQIISSRIESDSDDS